MMENLLGGEDPLDKVVAELRQYEAWPADDVQDRKFVADLQKKYPGVDLTTEAFQWRMWMLDHSQKKEVKPRARFTRWIANSLAFRSERRTGSQNRKNQSRTAPARAEQFGPESSTQLTGW